MIKMMRLFTVLLTTVTFSRSYELLIESNYPILNSSQSIEYNGKYISLTDSIGVNSRITDGGVDGGVDSGVILDGLNGDVVIEKNDVFTLNYEEDPDTDAPDSPDYSGAQVMTPNYTSQPITSKLWNLDSLDGTIDNKYTFLYTGKNVNNYVIDSGVNKLGSGSEFEDRLLQGTSFFGLETDTNDCLGHGTHVASIIGSKSYGVAKKANIIPVRVFGCTDSTTTFTILKAIYWIIKQPKGIVNLSISGPANVILNNSIRDLINQNFIVIVAAGNDGTNSCYYSPSSVQSAIVVGCSNAGNGLKNGVCSYSNEGSCVTLFAPGNIILGINYKGGSIYKSGTSMSSPHVAGVASTVYEKYPGMSQKNMKDLIVLMASNSSLFGMKLPDSPNLELRGFKDQVTPPLPPPPSLFGCKSLSIATCYTNPNCKIVPHYGCRVSNFCGFRTKRECLNRTICKFVSVGKGVKRCKIA